MKKLIFITLLTLSMQYLDAQSLMDIYRKGTVKLIPDKEYAQGNNWEKVFATYYDTLYRTPMGERKSIVLMPDGALIVNHEYRDFYSLFDPNGKFVKEFSITNDSGKPIKNNKAIKGVMNNTFFTGLDNMGKMLCFDFDGNYKKTLTLDYMTKDIIPLADSKIAVVGWVIWSDRFRDFVAIVDYNTNEQKIIWEHFTDRAPEPRWETVTSGAFEGSKRPMFRYTYKFKKNGMISCNTMPYTKDMGISTPPQIKFANNQLIVAIPVTGEILIYDINGKLKAKDKIGWAKNSISVEEQKEIQKEAIKKYKNISEKPFPKMMPQEMQEEYRNAYKTFLVQMEEDLGKISTPIPAPVFSTIIKDSDDNLLFFEMPKEEGANKFNVWIYNNGGKFVCQSSFVCDEYDLAIMPSKMIFHKGYIYALQTLKEPTGNPLRLVRFKVSAD